MFGRWKPEANDDGYFWVRLGETTIYGSYIDAIVLLVLVARGSTMIKRMNQLLVVLWCTAVDIVGLHLNLYQPLSDFLVLEIHPLKACRVADFEKSPQKINHRYKKTCSQVENLWQHPLFIPQSDTGILEARSHF